MLRACVVLLLATAAVVAGCGSDDSEDGAETISREEFIERGDQLCAEFQDAADPLERRGDRAIEDRDLETLVDLTDRLSALAEQTLEQFRSLPVPAGEEEAVSSYLDAQSRQIAAAERLGEAFARRDLGEITALAEEVRSLDEESDQIAQQIGFEVCGQE